MSPALALINPLRCSLNTAAAPDGEAAFRCAMDESAPLVYVVDDDAAVREALTNLLRSVGWNVRAFASAQEFLSGTRRDVPSCLVLDVRLPGSSGLDLQNKLRQTADTIPIVFITGHADVPTTVRAMKAGAVEFLPKPFHEEDLLRAIREALERAAWARSQRAGQEDVRRKSELLTRRERQVMALLVTGRLNKQIAAELGISETTVKIHRRHIMKKMASSSLLELARMVEKLRSARISDDRIST